MKQDDISTNYTKGQPKKKSKTSKDAFMYKMAKQHIESNKQAEETQKLSMMNMAMQIDMMKQKFDLMTLAKQLELQQASLDQKVQQAGAMLPPLQPMGNDLPPLPQDAQALPNPIGPPPAMPPSEALAPQGMDQGGMPMPMPEQGGPQPQFMAQ